MSMSSRISTVEMQDIVEKLKLNRHRSSTKRNYYAIWKIFSNFYLRLDVKLTEWQDRLTLFVGYLIDNKKQSQTIRSYVSTIKSVLKDDRIKISDDQYLISSLTRACKLKNDQV